MDELLADFLAETAEGLAELDSALLRLERSPSDSDTLALVFRLVHTIKGTCGFLGLPRLERVAHAAENLLGEVRDGTRVADGRLIGAVLAAADRMRAIVDGLARDGAEPAGDDEALIGEIEALRAGAAAPAAGPATPAPIAPAPIAPLPVAPDAVTPAPGESTPASLMPESLTSAPAGEPAGAEAPVAGQTIRVAVEVLDHLMTLAGELVLTRNQLLQVARSQSGHDFTVPLQRLSQITSDLQEGVMKTRMQPIGSAWAKLPRLVRDLSQELGKPIELVMQGAATELDRQVLELIRDPLTHMVRNCADHAIEPPAERRAAGKPVTGKIRLTAVHEGGHIIVQIADDGRGLPVERIRAKALALGFATAAELAAMSEAEIIRFIFRAGFSTAQEVTAVSGRGVGMDVVKTNIERIGGAIDVRSEAGRGTSFTIKIPLTLAIVAALVVQAGGERFAIPQIGVLELVRVGAGSEHKVETIHDTKVLRLRDRLLPLADLTDLLQLTPAETTDRFVVVAQVGGALLGLIVDRVFDTEEIVVKPVAPILRHLSVFGGNTILGDGSVIMILDPNGIARAVGLAGAEERPEEAARPEALDVERSALLLMRAGGDGLMAVPLRLVARLEQVARADVERSAGGPVTQYRGRLMKLVMLAPRPEDPADWPELNPVLVFARGRHIAGLVVDEIVDVVQDSLNVQLGAAGPGLLGSAVIDGRATDLLDVGYHLAAAIEGWFDDDTAEVSARLLLVGGGRVAELVPVLAAAGYGVATANDEAGALRLREGGARFDAVIVDRPTESDEFIRALRDAGSWRGLPLIALVGRVPAQRLAQMRAAGWTDCVPGGDRALLAASLASCLSATVAA